MSQTTVVRTVVRIWLLYSSAAVRWYRTDQNGTVTIRSPGTEGGGYSVSVERGAQDYEWAE